MPSSNTFFARQLRVAKLTVPYGGSMSIARKICGGRRRCDQAFELCAQLAHQHAARLGVRTLDTLHVASALELKAVHFWTFDERQAKLALAAGLKTV